MGLDATVYCDCFERGCLLTPPRPEWDVYVEEPEGIRMLRNPTGMLNEFFRWNNKACEHESGIRLHHRIGNIGAVALIRRVLSDHPGNEFPTILSKVVYSGTHAGDYIPADQVSSLTHEIHALSMLHPRGKLEEEIIRYFETQLRELVAVAMELRKPIVF